MEVLTLIGTAVVSGAAGAVGREMICRRNGMPRQLLRWRTFTDLAGGNRFFCVLLCTFLDGEEGVFVRLRQL